MKYFSVYVPQEEDSEKVVFIQDGFSLKALILNIVWTLYNKLYFVSSVIILLVFSTEALSNIGYISEHLAHVIKFGIPLFCGFNANNWLEKSLLKKNFEFVGTILANNPLEAQIKFFSEYDVTDKSSKIPLVW